MPYEMKKVPHKRNCYTVKNSVTKKVFAECSTKKNALAQLRLLRAIQFNKDFVLRPRSEIKKKSRKNKTQKKTNSKLLPPK
jgi:hypothetical protein